ncbi:MAG: hypothetical protein SGARI_000823 [Bacillariaceae sp.]
MDKSDKKKGNGEASKAPTTRREKRRRAEMDSLAAASSPGGTSAPSVATTVTTTTAKDPQPYPAPSSVPKGFASLANPFVNGFFPKGSKLVGVSKSGKKYVFEQDARRASAKTGSPAPPVPVPVPDEKLWSKVMPHLPRCTSAEGIRASSYFTTSKTPVSSSTSRNNCLRRLLQELVALEDDLPSMTPNIWLRYDEETPQYIRAIIAAPQGTPYSLGLFAFDIFVPDSYPAQSPSMQLLTTGGGTVRFSPNLYQNGKVCLSLLGTWSGPKWNPMHSSLLQVLMSIQGLILGFEHPYYLEPGHGGWEGEIKNNPSTTTTKPAASASATGLPGAKPASTTIAAAASAMKAAPTAAKSTDASNEATSSTTKYTTIPVVDSTQPSHIAQYEDRLRIGTVKYAMLDMLKNATDPNLSPRHYLYPFKEVILCHFYHCKDSIIPTASIFAAAAKSSTQRRTAKTASDDLGKVLKELPIPSIIGMALAAMDSSKDADGDAKMSAAATGGNKTDSVIESIIASKRKELEEAVAKQDYVTAGRLQTELTHLGDAAVGTHCSIEQRIQSKENDMEVAAASKDYIAAGKFQASLQRLKKNKKVLQHLEARMFDAASKLDFVRAGRFQEQFQVLLQHSENSGGNTLGKSVAAASSKKENPFASYKSSVSEALASAKAAAGASFGMSSAPPIFASFGSPPPLTAASLPPPPIDDGFYDDGYTFMADSMHDASYYGDY